MDVQTVVVVVALFVAVPFAAVLLRKLWMKVRRRLVRRAWREVAEQRGLSFDEEQMQMEGRLEDYEVRVGLRWREFGPRRNFTPGADYEVVVAVELQSEESSDGSEGRLTRDDVLERWRRTELPADIDGSGPRDEPFRMLIAHPRMHKKPSAIVLILGALSRRAYAIGVDGGWLEVGFPPQGNASVFQRQLDTTVGAARVMDAPPLEGRESGSRNATEAGRNRAQTW